MTARLQSDEAGKDSKWADIDDDEDDWAPETVEWMDGTKSNVGATEAQLPPPVRQEDRVPSPSIVEHPAEPAEPVKPVLAAMHKPTVSQTTKTILRPGAQLNASPKPGLAQHSGADGSASSSSKGAVLPNKSPWAVLPPVEKIAPINPPVQQPQRPFQRDPGGFDALPPAPSPAQEIAADDFSRSLRDDRGTKELFNAHSGRYEPANEARRGSRNEQGYRQPAVLQRPLHGAVTNGPAEPSAAFQTHRSSIEGGAPWSRRRASSSLSAAGGRRPSLALSQDHSVGAHNDVAVESPKAAFASLDRSGAWPRGPHPPTEPPLVESERQPEAEQPPAEDPVAKQQRLMKEKIERARAAKQKEIEAEAAEAAARQERLKLKMAQLAAASPSPDTSAKHATSTAGPVQPPKLSAVSPPKPPVPTSEGEVAQYGMMKVHQPHPVKKNVVSEASLTAKANQDAGGDYATGYRGSVSPNKPVAGPTSQPSQHHVADNRGPAKQLPNAPAAPAAPLEKLGNSWKTSPSPNEYNWNQNTMAARSAVSGGSSVWGPPGSVEKSLGNGTFESKLSHPNFYNRLDNSRLDNRFDNSRVAPQGPLHGPIGSGLKGRDGGPTPPSNSQPRQSQFVKTFQSLSSENSAQQEQPSQSQPSHSPSVDDQAFASSHLDSSLQQSIAHSSSLHPQTAKPLSNSSFTNSNMPAQVALPPAAAIGMQDNLGSKLNTHDRSRDWIQQRGATTTGGWNNFKANEDRRMQVDIAKYKNDFKAVPQPEQKSQSSSGVYTYYREANGNVEAISAATQADGSIKRTVIGSYPANANNLAKVRESEVKHPNEFLAKPEQAPAAAAPLNGPPPATSSRFFPKGQASSSAPAAPPVINLPANAGAECDAPPPAEQGLFERDATQPAKVKFPVIAKVNLPGMKVPLPPRSPGLDKTFNATSAFPPTVPQSRAKPGLMHADDLKAKFGHLNLRAGVDVNTKPTFDVTSTHARPHVTQQVRTAPSPAAPKSLITLDTSSEVTSKPVAEDECIDHPDHGSLPAVRLPSTPHQNHQLGYSHDSGMLAPQNARPHSRYQKIVDTNTKVDVTYVLTEAANKVTIKLPGATTGKTVTLPPKAYGRRSPSNAGAASSNNAAFRGGRGSYAPRARGSFNAKFGGNHNQHGNVGAAAHRGGPARSRGGSTPASSSSSSPKPRGGWGSRNGPPAGPSAQ
jgi:hypothetical protein